MVAIDNNNRDLLVKLRGNFGCDLDDPTLARIQEIEKIVSRLRELLVSKEEIEKNSPDVIETRQFLIDTIQRDLLLIPRDRFQELLGFMRELQKRPTNASEDPLDNVVSVTSKLEAFLKDVIFDKKI
ncbi:MAG: hypothetical protein GYA55_05935 [SAR324 cluster bacterium]|uniref:Uncharacterized protein n=1 Tax=SAR324 cluster bacterium TaxID=2024889 RepID=A0A7X9IJJ2_9DELT|nr:hypothetical protein [SAR324 cluster bacterium]